MIISICGNGYCGSSAVTDYLRENKLISVSPYDIEFTFLYDVDALDDLRDHIVVRPVRFFSSDAAVKRYKRFIKTINSPKGYVRKLCGDSLEKLTDKYLSQITQLTWHGWWHFDVRNADFWTKNWNFRFLVKISNLCQRVLGKGIDFSPNTTMSISVCPKEFDSITNEYISEIIKLFNPEEKKYIVLDQPYPVGTYKTYAHYFSDDIKTINVVRDPRDVYIAAKLVNTSFSSWIPTENVEDFVCYFKLLCSQGTKSKNTNEITIRFEDLIYHYEKTTDFIDEFIGVKSPKTKKIFNPDRSINNTQLFRKHTELSSEIAYIEKELPEYLYDFNNVERMPNWSHSF